MVDLPLHFDIQDESIDLHFSLSNEHLPVTFDKVQRVLDARLQEKTVTPTDEAQTITPDDGYDGLSRVAVEPQKRTPATVRVWRSGNSSASVVLGYYKDKSAVRIQITKIDQSTDLNGLMVDDTFVVIFSASRTTGAPGFSITGGGQASYKLTNSTTVMAGGSTAYTEIYLVRIVSKTAQITLYTR